MYREVNRKYPKARTKLKFNEANKRALDWLVTDLISTTHARIQSAGMKTVDDVRRSPVRLAAFGDSARAHNAAWKKFLLASLYEQPGIVDERERSVAALDELFRFYVQRPDKMPPFYSEQARRQPPHRVACDYIAGMTDHFLLRQHEQNLKPNGSR
jgi:dGTPase